MKNKILTIIILGILSLAVISCSDDTNNDTETMPGMVLIEAANASFVMGSENGFMDETPLHNVSFTNDFWMDETEVTQAHYDSVMIAAYDEYFTPSWNDSYGAGDDFPAYEIAWGDAALYCNALSRFAGLDSVYTYSAINGTPGYLCELDNVTSDISKNGYRLPTEAEWEFACRGNVDNDYYWQKDYDPYPANAADSTEFNENAVWYGNSWQYGTDDPQFGNHPVKQLLPNAFGIYDMSGNVYEWTNDWYGEYSEDSQIDPTGAETVSYHVIRGGSWANHAEYLRSANRSFTSPCYYYYLMGFRTVRTAF